MITVELYSPEQFTTACELWTRLASLHSTSLQEGPYRSSPPVKTRDADFPEKLSALVFSDGELIEDSAHPWAFPNTIEMTLISYSDYGGSCADAANLRYLRDDIAYDCLSISENGVHGNSEVTMRLGELPVDIDGTPGFDRTQTGLDRLAHIVEMFEGLESYPLFSEESHSEYVDELADEAWDAWLGSDVEGELRDLGVDLGELSEALYDVKIKQVREAYYSFDGNEWTCETATSVHNGRHSEAVEHVAHEVFGWTPGSGLYLGDDN